MARLFVRDSRISGAGGGEVEIDTRIHITAQRLIIFHGSRFTIGYPVGWKIKNEGHGIVEFMNLSTGAFLAAGSISNPGALISSSEALTLFRGLLTGMQNNGISCDTTKGQGHTTVGGAR